MFEIVVAFIAEVFAKVAFRLFELTYEIGRTWWPLRSTRRFGHRTSEESDYLFQTRNYSRLPYWDADLCTPERLRTSLIRFAIRAGDRLPGPLPIPDITSTDLAHVQTLPAFAERIIFQSAEQRHNRMTIFLIIGEPGIGKTILAVQLLTYLTKRAEDHPKSPLPIYVNLKHFHAEIALGKMNQAFIDLVKASTRAGCPRFSNPTERAGEVRFEKLLRRRRDNIFLFDGMDEILLSDYSERVEAIAKFIDEHRAHTFVVTCRKDDYIRLTRRIPEITAVCYELLRWSPSMTRHAVRVVRGRGHASGLTKHIQEEFHRSFQSPLEIMVALRVMRLRNAAEPIDGAPIWRDFVEDRLKNALKEGIVEEPLQVSDILLALRRLARQELEPAVDRAIIPRELLEAAKKAGLVYETGQGYNFCIRPLAHYFLADSLAAELRQTSRLPPGVHLDSVSLRPVLLVMTTIFGRERVWLNFLAGSIDLSMALRQLGSHLENLASIITPEQVSAYQPLRTRMEEAVKKLIGSGDPIERKRCLNTLRLRPEIFDNAGAQILFSAIITQGGLEEKDWAARVLSSVRELRKKVPRLWVSLLWSTFEGGTLRRNLQVFIANKLGWMPRWLAGTLARSISTLLWALGMISSATVGASLAYGGSVLMKATLESKLHWRPSNPNILTFDMGPVSIIFCATVLLLLAGGLSQMNDNLWRQGALPINRLTRIAIGVATIYQIALLSSLIAFFPRRVIDGLFIAASLVSILMIAQIIKRRVSTSQFPRRTRLRRVGRPLIVFPPRPTLPSPSLDSAHALEKSKRGRGYLFLLGLSLMGVGVGVSGLAGGFLVAVLFGAVSALATVSSSWSGFLKIKQKVLQAGMDNRSTFFPIILDRIRSQGDFDRTRLHYIDLLNELRHNLYQTRAMEEVVTELIVARKLELADRLTSVVLQAWHEINLNNPSVL